MPRLTKNPRLCCSLGILKVGRTVGVARLCPGHSCARLSKGSDVMYNGSPQGCGNGGMREERGAETGSLPCTALRWAVPCRAVPLKTAGEG